MLVAPPCDDFEVVVMDKIAIAAADDEMVVKLVIVVHSDCN